jgi:AcrR family transcriptional regulator
LSSNPSLAEQVQTKRAEMMISAIEHVALRLFEERGFADVTVDEIALEAQISERTFFRYFGSKENVFQVRVDRRSDALRTALSTRPRDETPIDSFREAVLEVLAAEDLELVRRWAVVIGKNRELLQGVLGGIQLKIQRVIEEFLADRLGRTVYALEVIVISAAFGGVLRAATAAWFNDGSDFSETIPAAMAILDDIGIATQARVAAVGSDGDR